MTKRVLASLLFVLSFQVPVRAGTGDLDPTFGTGGTVVHDFGFGTVGAADMVQQTDGKLVLVGTTGASASRDDMVVVRLEADGTLDPTFGSGGMVTVDFAPYYAWGQRVMLAPDGSIVAVALGSDIPTGLINEQGLVARLTTTGALDATFGGGDGRTAIPGLWPMGGLVEPDGRIVVSGSDGFADASVVRLESDGDPDLSFSGDGRASIDVGYHFAVHVTRQSDGHLVLASGLYGEYVLARFAADGTPDAGFGTGGVVRVPRPELLTVAPGGVLVDGAGNIVVAAKGDQFETPPPSAPTSTVLLARHLADGALDSSFGTGGVTVTTAGSYGETGGVDDLLLQPDGRLLVVGAGSLAFGVPTFEVRRFDAAGRLDATFGAGGRAVAQLEGESAATAGALTGDGRLVVAGATNIPMAVYGDQEWGLARFDVTCPALPDGDDDGLGDACDPCTGPAVPMRLSMKLKRLGPPATDAKFGLAGAAVVPATPLLDPLASGVRVMIADALDATLIDTLLPPGARLVTTGVGWSGSASRASYRNVDVLAPRIAGIGSLSARVSANGEIRVKLKAQGPLYELSAGQLPLTATLVLDPPRSETGQCFTGTPPCTMNATGTSARCR